MHTTRRRPAAAVIGSGNIGTDLMYKLRRSEVLDIAAMVGIDPRSDGLARAAGLDVATTADGVEGLLAMSVFDDVDVVFDATSAYAHRHNDARLEPTGRLVVDLTPAAIGPYVVPAVNLSGLAGQRNLNMVTCGGQATVPIVAALSRVTRVHYAEIVASISSRSAGPGTRANIDEFTQTTARALQTVGGAARGKAIIVLNPAEPPMISATPWPHWCRVWTTRRSARRSPPWCAMSPTTSPVTGCVRTSSSPPSRQPIRAEDLSPSRIGQLTSPT